MSGFRLSSVIKQKSLERLTSIAIMYPDFQPLGAESAIEKGNKNMTKPAANSSTPAAVVI